MENLIILVHLLTALIILGLIMLQQGKGAEMGASFGSGSSQTLFGASGSGNFFSKMTAFFAVVFFVTSFSLAVLAKQKAQVDEGIPSLIESAIETPVADEGTSIDALPEVESVEVEKAEDLSEIPEE